MLNGTDNRIIMANWDGICLSYAIIWISLNIVMDN